MIENYIGLKFKCQIIKVVIAHLCSLYMHLLSLYNGRAE